MRIGVDAGSRNIHYCVSSDSGTFVEAGIEKNTGEPIEKLMNILERFPGKHHLSMTGVEAGKACEIIGIKPVIHAVAVPRGFELLYPDARTVFDIGGESSYFYSFEINDNRIILNDFSSNSICGAGGGALIEKMARRLEYSSLEDFVNGAMSSEICAKIAGRCGVFAESDVVHHSNKGIPVNSIAAGLCQMLARNFVNNVLRGKDVSSPVYMIGGVSKNKAVVRFLEELIEKEIIVPRENEYLKAYGTSMNSLKPMDIEEVIMKLKDYKPKLHFSYGRALSLQKSIPGKNNIIILDTTEGEEVELSLNEDYKFNENTSYFLGLDVGSVSTKAAILDLAGNFAFGIYRRTKGKPIDAIIDLMRRIEEYKPELIIKGAGVTGSGRDVAGKIIGADVVKNEITAQAQGARFFYPRVDTVFEIGGQDSKYIQMDQGRVVSNVMNKACAASTGSFLEEQARVLGIKIKEQFANLALRSKNPCILAEKCAILMTTSLTHYNSSSVEDRCAGLAYAVVDNYLHRVVEKNPIGDYIVFQGAVAFNDSIVAALETRTCKRINVPKYPHLTGAIGIAIITRDKYERGEI